MVATLSLRVCTGTNAATVSSAQSGISFLAIDSAANDTTTRQANPINVGSNSYEKHCRLLVDAPPNTSVGPFRFYTDGSTTTGATVKMRSAGSGGLSVAGDATPVTAAMTGVDSSAYISTSAYQWDAATYAATGSYTRALVLQLQTTASASPGAWPQKLLYLSYDEA